MRGTGQAAVVVHRKCPVVISLAKYKFGFTRKLNQPVNFVRISKATCLAKVPLALEGPTQEGHPS